MWREVQLRGPDFACVTPTLLGYGNRSPLRMRHGHARVDGRYLHHPSISDFAPVLRLPEGDAIALFHAEPYVLVTAVPGGGPR